ncbi:MAG: ASKHA domain-containing protein, partial [Fervidobacterium sp.]
ERLLEAMSQKIAEEWDVDYEILKTLPNVLRCANWEVTVTIRDNRILNVEKGDTLSKIYGFVVDVGTSKIVGHLVDLTTGRTVGVGAIENPQLIYGADIITRTVFAVNGKGLKKLQELSIKGINSILNEICSKAGVDPNDIYEVLAVGNSIILHILFLVQPKYLALSPFTPAFRKAPELPARELNIKINPGGFVSTLPIVAGFVGGDAVADCLATGIHKSNKNTLLLDIGTNTEILLGNRKGLFCCSCAAGPAFESYVDYGMKALEGAIEEVSIDQNYEVRYKTIGGSKPVGICGSALVQIVSEMFKRGIIDHTGTFNSSLKTQRITDDGFILASRNETATGREIKITHKDVDEIILAKAAIRTGCSILMRKMNLKDEDIERVFIAGDFGSALNLESLICIGLLPNIPLPLQKIKKVGNASVEGAKMCLISRDMKKEISRILSKIRYVELTVDPEFENEFIKNLCINHCKKFTF